MNPVEIWDLPVIQGGRVATSSVSKPAYPPAISSSSVLTPQSGEGRSASFSSRLQSSSFAVNMIGENVNALAIELIKQFPHFKFSGQRSDFQNWQDQWEDYVQLVRQVYGEPSYFSFVAAR